MKRERGSVLFLSLLVTLVLTGLLLLEVERTMVEISMIGNERFAKSAYAISEAGLVTTTAKAAIDPQSFLIFAGMNNFKVTDLQMGVDVFDRSRTGSFGLEGANAGIVNFSTELTHPITTNRIPGFSVGGTCFRRYVWTTTGQYGLAPETGSSTQSVKNAYRLSVQRTRSVVYQGPVPCAL
jgi:hypothetical protein